MNKLYTFLPPEYPNISGSYFPWQNLIGDIPIKGRYWHRGIPFRLKWRKDRSEGFWVYWLDLEYWTPEGTWKNLGELDTTIVNDVHGNFVHWNINIQKMLDPIFDVYLGQGKGLNWF